MATKNQDTSKGTWGGKRPGAGRKGVGKGVRRNWIVPERADKIIQRKGTAWLWRLVISSEDEDKALSDTFSRNENSQIDDDLLAEALLLDGLL